MLFRSLAAPLLVRGVPRDLRDAQLQDVRLGIFDGVQDELGNVEPGAVYVEFWRAGPPDPEAALPERRGGRFGRPRPGSRPVPGKGGPPRGVRRGRRRR